MTTEAVPQPTEDIIVQSKIDHWWDNATEEQRETRKKIWKGIKQWFNDTSEEIRAARSKFKEAQRQNDPSLWKPAEDLLALRREFRHRHIAWSIIKGRAYDKIECPAKNNLPDENLINGYVEEYEKTLCPDSE